MFHQTFEPHDLLVICLLIVLEGMLSMDNALVLGLLARRLPEEMRAKALTYGLIGALVFRLVAIGAASSLLRWHGAELIGGLFLLYIAIKHLWKGSGTDHEEIARKMDGEKRSGAGLSSVRSVAEVPFWKTVASIEFTDILFAVDSILAAVALVGPAPANTPADQLHPKLWVVFVGGMGGVVLMRFAAIIFIKLLERFPRFDSAAYLLVMLIGAKMVTHYFLRGHERLGGIDFNNPHDCAAWIFWGLMAAAFAFGFLPRHQKARPH